MSDVSLSFLIAALIGIGLIGCSSSESTPSPAGAAPSSTYVASSEPVGAIAVGDARSSVKDEQQVVLVGRIGGSAEPFVNGAAAFTIVDSKVPHCAADEGCPTPWDYCCTQDQVKDNIALVKLVDAHGKSLPQDARTLLGVKELSTVFVRGKAKRDAKGNLSLLADQVYVRE